MDGPAATDGQGRARLTDLPAACLSQLLSVCVCGCAVQPPTSHPAEEVTDRLLQRLRHPELPGCRHADPAATSAAGAFASVAEFEGAAAAAPGSGQAEAALAGMCRGWEQQAAQHRQRHKPLGPRCRLLARKFVNGTQAAALAAMAPCTSAALILNNGICAGETPQQAALRRAWQQAAPLVLLGLGGLLLPLLLALCLGAVAAGTGSNGKRCTRH